MLRYLQLIIRGENVPFPISNAKKLENESHAEEEDMLDKRFLIFDLLLSLQYGYSFCHLTLIGIHVRGVQCAANNIMRHQTVDYNAEAT